MSRTTITLTPEADSIIRRRMRERGVSFKDAVNEAIIESAPAERPRPYRTPTFDMGEPLVNLDNIGRVLAQLDDEEYLRKLELGK